MSETVFERIALVTCIIVTISMLFVASLFYTDRALAASLLSEAGPFEIVGEISCLVASIFILLTFWHSRSEDGFFNGYRNPFLFLLGLAFAFLFLEEISWGQNILGFSTPDQWSKINMQKETNLHNLAGIHFKAHELGIVCLLLYFLVVPLSVYASQDVARLLKAFSLPIPSLAVALIFCWTFLTKIPYTILYTRTSGMPINFGELQETFFQFGAALFALQVYQRRNEGSSVLKISRPAEPFAADR